MNSREQFPMSIYISYMYEYHIYVSIHIYEISYVAYSIGCRTQTQETEKVEKINI